MKKTCFDTCGSRTVGALVRAGVIDHGAKGSSMDVNRRKVVAGPAKERLVGEEEK